jgi:hypothetical protein
VDAPGYAADLDRIPGPGYTIRNNRIAVVTDRLEDLLGVHPPSCGMVDLGGMTIERCPLAPGTG